MKVLFSPSRCPTVVALLMCLLVACNGQAASGMPSVWIDAPANDLQVEPGQLVHLEGHASPEFDTRDSSTDRSDGFYNLPPFEYQVWYTNVVGDEYVQINIAADVDIVGQGYFHLGVGQDVLLPENGWEARPYRPQDCDVEAWPEDGGVHAWCIQPLDSGLPFSVRGQAWRSTFTLCRIDD